MVKALVTGGTGFVGSYIVRALIEAGHTARILRREKSPLDLVADLPVEHAIGDVLDGPSLVRAMEGCDWVFHVAAVSDYWRAERIKLYLVNVNGTINVLNAARKAGVKRVIFTSSAAAVGLRDDGRPADETVPFNMSPKQFPYAHSKHLAEQEVLRAVEQGLDAVIVNPVGICGPGDLNQIFGTYVITMASSYVPVYLTGGQTLIDVRDVASLHLAAAEKGRTRERYLLGAVDLSIKAIQKLLADIIGVPAPVLPVPPAAIPLIALGVENLMRLGVSLPGDAAQLRLSARHMYFDCNKAWRELGEPKIDIRRSLQETYDWYVERGIIKRTGVPG